MFSTLFGRPTSQSPPPRRDAALRVRPTLVALEARDVPAVIYDNTFALTGSGGDATVRVIVDNPAPAATPTYIWTYKVTNVNIGSNDPEDYRQSDSQTSFWTFADARLDFAKAEFAFGSGPSGWTNGLFESADAADTTIYFGLYAGVNVDHPNLGHNESAIFSFTTAPRLLVPQSATFGDDTFGEATGDIIGPGELLTTGILVTPLGDAAENGPGSGFVISRAGGDLSQPLTVALGVGGTAADTTDYTALPASVTFEPYQSDIILTLTPAADNVVEGDETVSVTVSPAAGYVPVGTGTAVVTIEDTPSQVWIADEARTVYWGSSLPVEFQREGGDLTQALTFEVAIAPASGEDPAQPGDFTVSGASEVSPGVYAVTFAAGSQTASLTLIAGATPATTPRFVQLTFVGTPSFIPVAGTFAEFALADDATNQPETKRSLTAEKKLLERRNLRILDEITNLNAAIRFQGDRVTRAIKNVARTQRDLVIAGQSRTAADAAFAQVVASGAAPTSAEYRKAQQDAIVALARLRLQEVIRNAAVSYNEYQGDVNSQLQDLKAANETLFAASVNRIIAINNRLLDPNLPP